MVAVDNLKIQYVAVDRLCEHPENPRQGDVGAISESIKHNGVYRPIVVQKSSGHILAGNHTYKALKALGHERIPAVLLDVDDGQALRIMIADNRTAELGDYDTAQLIDVLQELASDLDGTGWDEDDLDTLIASMQQMPNLDELEDKYGEIEEGDLTVKITLKVDPKTATLWDKYATDYESAEKAFETLLRAGAGRE